MLATDLREASAPGSRLRLTIMRGVSPIVVAAFCIKPRGLLTQQQVARVDMLKTRFVDFAMMRHLAMRFRGILRSGGAMARLKTRSTG
jgi:hypothetical protein